MRGISPPLEEVSIAIYLYNIRVVKYTLCDTKSMFLFNVIYHSPTSLKIKIIF